MGSTGKTDPERRPEGRPCPLCGKPTPPRERNRAHPFCSPRCQLADLGRWLDEDYRL